MLGHTSEGRRGLSTCWTAACMCSPGARNRALRHSPRFRARVMRTVQAVLGLENG